MNRIPLLLLQMNITIDGYYDNKVRCLNKYIIKYFKLDWNNSFCFNELSYSVVLKIALIKKAKQLNQSKWKKWAKIGAVGVVGGGLIAVTGGIAAPLLAAGIGAIGLASASAFILSSTGIATVYIVFGVAGTYSMSKKMKAVVDDIKYFKFYKISKIDSALNVVIGMYYIFYSYIHIYSYLSIYIPVFIGINGWLVGLKQETEDEESKDDDIKSNETKSKTRKFMGKVGTKMKSMVPKFKKDKQNNDNSTENEEIIEDEINFESNTYWNNVFGFDSMNVMDHSMCYSLLFNPEDLINVGKGISAFLAKEAAKEVFSQLKSQAYKLISAAGIAGLAVFMSAFVWPLAILKIGDLIQNPWTIATNKANKAGKILANLLIQGYFGRRPITLVSFSVGCNVIFECLKELVKQKKEHNKSTNNNSNTNNNNNNNNKNKKHIKKKQNNDDNDIKYIDPSTIIDNVIILGGPHSANENDWKEIRQIVGDRIINCYSTSDWILRFIYRTTSLQNLSVAGLQPINVDGIENINLTNIVTSHHEYYDKTPFILKSFLPFIFL